MKWVLKKPPYRKVSGGKNGYNRRFLRITSSGLKIIPRIFNE